MAALPIEVTATLAALAVASQSSLPRRVRSAWLLLSLAVGTNVVGDLPARMPNRCQT